MNLARLVWTNHAKFKMRFYGLSEARVRRVLNSPLRIEDGIADETVAMLQRAGSKKHPYEIWVMIQKLKIENSKLKIGRDNHVKVISAWRYPGITKPGGSLPPEIIRELCDVGQ